MSLPRRYKKHKRLTHHDASVIRRRPHYANHIWAINPAHHRPGIGRMKAELLPNLRGNLAIELMREINTSFEPNGILNL